MDALFQNDLKRVVTVIAQRLDSLQIDYAIMGGAAVCLIAPNPGRATQDVDVVIHVDHRSITADRLTQRLITSYPADFAEVLQYGHAIPALRLPLPDGKMRLVELEVFDQASWPQRPQYDLQRASRVTQNINGQRVKFFSAEWIMREKILSQYQRQGVKSQIDRNDILNLVDYVVPGKPELNFNNDSELQTALASLLQKMPALRAHLSRVISCRAVLG